MALTVSIPLLGKIRSETLPAYGIIGRTLASNAGTCAIAMYESIDACAM